MSAETQPSAQDAVETSAETQSADTQAQTPILDAAALQEQLTALEQKAQEYLEGWQRARAEFANYKKRIERELQETRENAVGLALKSVLPVTDDFYRALDNVPADLRENPWVGGITMVQRKLDKVLEDNGVVAFDPVGEMFDPSRHEAIGSDADSDAPSGQVTTTLQRGYMVGDKVLRPALVRVAP